jgi:glycosyltransferase involved in cell wall biosynthesis
MGMDCQYGIDQIVSKPAMGGHRNSGGFRRSARFDHTHMLKILNVIDLLNPTVGGAEERTYQMCHYLRLAGVEVDILTTNHLLDKEAVAKLPEGRNYYMDAVQFRFLFPFGARNWLEHNIARYDVVHISKNWTLLSYIAGSVAAEKKIPYVFSTMGFASIHNRSRYLKQFYRKHATIPLIRRASACISVTNEEKEDLVAAGASPDNVHVIPNGIIGSDFLHRNDQHFRDLHQLGNRKIILFIGRMDPIKGVHLLIDAFAEKRAKLKDWCLVLVGTKTGYREEMQKKTANLGLRDDILFLDPLFGMEKSAAYHAAEFIVIPSIKDAMTIIAPEAACCGKPVLITKSCDFGELSKCGGAVEVEPTIEGLAAGLEQLTNYNCDRVVMGRCGQDFVMNRFKLEQVAQKYQDLFQTVALPEPRRTFV